MYYSFTFTCYTRIKQFSIFVNPTRTLFAEAQLPQIGGNPSVWYRGDNNVVTSPSMYRMDISGGHRRSIAHGSEHRGYRWPDTVIPDG